MTGKGWVEECEASSIDWMGGAYSIHLRMSPSAQTDPLWHPCTKTVKQELKRL